MMGFKSFLKNTNGNLAIMFSIAAVPLLISVGVAVDMLRTNSANAILQAATDSAAIAAVSGKKNSLNDAQIEGLVNAYIAANNGDKTIQSVKVKEFGWDKAKAIYHVKLTGKIDTMFMAMAGYKTMDIGAYSEVDGGTTPTLELSLVLDVTNSMNAEGRLDALKVASKALVDKLMKSKPAEADIKIGIVPFSNYVNVGTGNATASWLEAQSTVPYKTCWDTYPNAVYSNCTIVKKTGINDGVPYTYDSNECATVNYGAPVNVCSMYAPKWYGVVGSRNSGLDSKLYGVGASYPGLVDTWGPQQITDLTPDQTKLNADINSLTANAETYIPTGLLWGWELLETNKPFTTGKSKAAMKAVKGQKVLVLMTDGDNTLSSNAPYHNGSDGAVADAKTKELCDGIKKDDIKLFTVAFKVEKASSKAMLLDCATSPAEAFDAADDAALLDAFGQIAESLTAMRLTK
jgi:Flp pilus assembly protein TadG